VVNGSIFQTAQPINYGYQPLFEDRRPRNVGDTLTIVLQENVSASKSSSANASRDGKTNFGFDTVPRYLQGSSAMRERTLRLPAAIPLTVKVARTPAIPLAAR
jgi:flagellar basal body L-ring protein FlgH